VQGHQRYPHRFELASHVNKIFEADKRKSSEEIFALEKQLDKTIKDIIQACADNSDLILLEKAINNDQNVAKRQPQLLKERSEGVHNKFLNMQKSLEESLQNLKRAANAFPLSSQEVVKAIYSGHQGAELSKIDQKLQSLKFPSYFEVKKTSEGLEISTRADRRVVTEINPQDLKTIEAIDIKLGCFWEASWTSLQFGLFQDEESEGFLSLFEFFRN